MERNQKYRQYHSSEAAKRGGRCLCRRCALQIIVTIKTKQKHFIFELLFTFFAHDDYFVSKIRKKKKNAAVIGPVNNTDVSSCNCDVLSNVSSMQVHLQL